MNDDQVKYLLSAIQVDLSKHTYSGSPKRTRWLNIKCPFAPWRHAGGQDQNPSFGITVKEEGRSVYKCFSCGSKGRLSQLPSQLGHLRKRDYTKQRKWAELAELQAATSRPLPKWEDVNPYGENDAAVTDSGTGPRSHRSEMARFASLPFAMGHAYLRERGITWQSSLLCDLRYDPGERRIVFPVYDRYENFVGATGRSTRKGNSSTRGSDPKVKDYYGLPKRAVFLRLPSNRHGPRIIVEGLFDYARLVGFGYRNTHAILGTAYTPEKGDILIADGEPVFFLMDNDLAGWQALFGRKEDNDGRFNTEGAWAYELYKEIPTWIVPYPTVFDGTDPGSLQAETLRKMLSRAWLFTGRAPLDPAGNPVWRRVKNP